MWKACLPAKPRCVRIATHRESKGEVGVPAHVVTEALDQIGGCLGKHSHVVPSRVGRHACEAEAERLGYWRHK